MYCVVTAGPTYEPLDEVRRLTNFSTGRLGAELAGALTLQGHAVTFLAGQLATFKGEVRARQIQWFTTTENLREQLRLLAKNPVDAVFHAAAVSDFRFGKVFRRSKEGELTETQSGKFSTREGALLAELLPTPKIIAELRSCFPTAWLCGWKYEVEGERENVIALAHRQMAECSTDACVTNGPAYGRGFGLVTRGGEPAHFSEPAALYKALEQAAAAAKKT